MSIVVCELRNEEHGGGFIGQANAELKQGGAYGPSGGLTDTNPDVLAVLTQSGDKVKLRFANPDLLRDCDLEASITRNTAYIIGDRVCDANVGGVSKTISISGGNISVGDYGDADVIIRVDGFAGGSSNGDLFTLNFRGKVKRS